MTVSRRSSLLRPALRFGLVSATGLAAFLPVLPAHAAQAPLPPTAMTTTVGDRFLDLTWSGGEGTGAVLRDVTGQPSPYTLTTGRAVTPTSATTAHDTGFTNVGTTTYAVWSTAVDGTPSDAPLVQDVAQAPLVATSLSFTTSVTAVPWGRSVTFTGRLTRPGDVPVVGQPIELYGRIGGTTDNRLLRRVITGVDGAITTSLAPSRSTDFSLRFVGDAFSAPSASVHHSVLVLPRLTAAFVPSSIVRFETSVLTGQVVPVLSNAALKVQRRIGLTWTDTYVVRTASNGTYRLALSPALGVYTYRVVLPGSAALMQAISPVATLRVDARDLYDGLHGDDVLALQRRLASLRYDPGKLDGVYGYDLHHAVMAFQKVERLPVTGRWTRTERIRNGSPTAWRVRYPTAGRAVEVSVTRQVLILSEGGRVVRVIDVSTGTEKPYTFEGVTSVAHTPRGRFSVLRKIDGVRVSRLGELYRPAYFYQGWAIHGSSSVPSYPASHGCIRITNPNMDRLFALLLLGMPVSVYDE